MFYELFNLFICNVFQNVEKMLFLHLSLICEIYLDTITIVVDVTNHQLSSFFWMPDVTITKKELEDAAVLSLSVNFYQFTI